MPNVAAAPNPVAAFAEEVRAGLNRPGQKELPSKYFYDAVGSKLFEVICELPEYGLTRADERLLLAHAAEIAERIPGDAILCELGSGSGKKTRRILEAFAPHRHTLYFPIEISSSALALCQRELGDLGSVTIVGLEREYLDGLHEVAAARKRGQHIVVLFLGSTIGNFSPPADGCFLHAIREILEADDALLLGTDLEKPEVQLLAAYDDPLGVTATFNLNLLARINRELDANFRLEQFEHLAKLNTATGSIEMHLRSLCRQTVFIKRAELSVAFEHGETIWTENSHKYSLEEIGRLAHSAGFHQECQWIDQQWLFAETLLRAV